MAWILAWCAGAAWAQDTLSPESQILPAIQTEPLPPPLLWFEQAGSRAGLPGEQARQAVEILLQAGIHGLDPENYDAVGLRRAVAQAAAGPGLPPDRVAALDAALTTAMRLYLTDLHMGRVNPRQVHANFKVSPAAGFDAASYLYTAVAEHRLPQAAAEAAPQIPLYADLLHALASYRQLGNHAAWQTPLPAIPGGKLQPGQAYTGLQALAYRLAALGDLPADSLVPARYEGVLVGALQRFQRRHGLKEDGVLGKGTLVQLDVTPAHRVRQIELSLERLRWTPLLQAERMVVVNLPEFVLRAYEARAGQIDLKLEMRVIVGEAMKTDTPVFDEDMRFIEFSPYWNIPISIARAETIPRLRSNPGYLQQQGMEFVARDGSVSRTVSEANLQAVRSGQMRIRQRPGPRNALGDIKFVLPNNSNIYLHHTPATQLFSRERRDFSHGCIRVEEPVALAQFVLQNEPQWTEQRIRDAMSQGRSRTIQLEQPLPVVIAYSTVVAKHGAVYFFPDIYGHDKLLDAALRESIRARSVLRANFPAAN